MTDERPDPRLVAIGDRIRDARVRKNMTQAELANLVSRGTRSVYNWERGVTNTHRHLARIAPLLDTSESWLRDGETATTRTNDALALLRDMYDEIRLLRLDLKEREGL